MSERQPRPGEIWMHSGLDENEMIVLDPPQTADGLLFRVALVSSPTATCQVSLSSLTFLREGTAQKQHPAAPYLMRVLAEDGDDGRRLPNGLRPGFVERNREFRITDRQLCGKTFGPVPNPPPELQCFVCERRPNHDGSCSEEPDLPGSMTKAQLVDAINMFGRVNSGYDPGITEEMVVEADGRFAVSIPVDEGTALLNVPRATMERLFAKVLKTLAEAYGRLSADDLAELAGFGGEKAPLEEEYPVHASHCCAVHGCKYLHDDSLCPVFSKKIVRSHSGQCQNGFDAGDDPLECGFIFQPFTVEESSMSQIRPEFTVHRLNAAGFEKANKISEIFSETLTKLEELCGSDGRQVAIVRTHLEEAAWRAKRAVADRSENQEPASTPAIIVGMPLDPSETPRVDAGLAAWMSKRTARDIYDLLAIQVDSHVILQMKTELRARGEDIP